MIFIAFDKPQATISEESQGSDPNERAREVELSQLGDLILFKSHTNTQCMHTVFKSVGLLVSDSEYACT